MWNHIAQKVQIIPLFFFCLVSIVTSQPASTPAIEKIEKQIDHHNSREAHYKEKADKAYDKGEKSCIGACIHTPRMAYYFKKSEKHQKAVSAGQKKLVKALIEHSKSEQSPKIENHTTKQ